MALIRPRPRRVKIFEIRDRSGTIGVAVLGIDEDQVDVRRDVELAPAELAHADDDQLLGPPVGAARRTVAFDEAAAEDVHGPGHGQFGDQRHAFDHFAERGEPGQIARGDAGIGALLELAQHRLEIGFAGRLRGQPCRQVFARHRQIESRLDLDRQCRFGGQQTLKVTGCFEDIDEGGHRLEFSGLALDLPILACAAAHPLRGSTSITPRLFSRLRQLPRAHPRLGVFLRAVAWTATLAYFAFALLLLALRYAILPQIESYRGDIEQMLGTAINRPVGIRRIETHWAGLRPALTLEGFEIRDARGLAVLGFDQVEAELSWSSLWHLQLRLARIELDAPTLALRRDRDGRIFAAGLEITPQPGTDEEFVDWLLVQDQVIIRDATITWQDDLRKAPPLDLKHLNFQLDNSFSRHRFGLTADPPRQLAARIDIRGDFKGRDFDRLEAWKGEAYAELDYADLAVWRHWVDYPINLPQGSGALRLWLGFADKQLQATTADVRLADVRLQLRRDLPELDMLRLEGRVTGRRTKDGFEAELKNLTLATRGGIAVPPIDLKLAWQGAAANRPPQGKASANGLDLAAMANLAAHLPLDDTIRASLARHAPRGRVYDLKLDWKGSPEAKETPQTWAVGGRFEGLGLTALGPVPGMTGINGRIDGNEKGGSVQLNGQRAAFELPTVFADPILELEAFAADLDWKSGADGLQVKLNEVTFHNKDAAGDAKGIWRSLPEGPGALDLDARLTRGSGNAAWRYMPLAVGKEVRDWLRTAISGGKATDTTLKLRGDLRRFPFRDGKGGIFEVRGKFHDTTLRYAEDWPEINNIEGELLFAGQRMLITGKSGKIFGAAVRDVRAEIADIEQAEELLTVSGKVTGPTTDFLRFIESSPVGERIDHFTKEMHADGNGELDLKLGLPLRKMDKSRVRRRVSLRRQPPDGRQRISRPSPRSAAPCVFPPTISRHAAFAARCWVLRSASTSGR